MVRINCLKLTDFYLEGRKNEENRITISEITSSQDFTDKIKKEGDLITSISLKCQRKWSAYIHW